MIDVYSARIARIYFWSKVDRSRGPDACWPWAGKTDRDGYGRAYVYGHHFLAHRYALEQAAGKSIGEAHALHHCDRPACCNPAHLYEGTPIDNVRDRVIRGRGKGRAAA